MDADLQLIRFAAVHLFDFHASELEMLVDPSEVFLIAGNAFKALDYQHVECARLGPNNEVQNSVAALQRRAGFRAVGIDMLWRNLDAIPLCEFFAEPHLIFDGSVVLFVA